MRRLLAPRLWGGHVLAVVLVAAAVLLGLWQLGAWQQRRDDEARDLTRSDPVALAGVLGPDDPFPARSVGQPVRLSGTWVGAATVFVSGRAHAGVDGYWMVTPLTAGAPSAPALPVVLGWVASPDVAPAPPRGEADLVGWLQPPEGTGDPDADPGDRVLPQLRVADLVQLLDQDLYGAYAVAQDGVVGLPAADLAQLPAAGRFTAVRNPLYGIRWWFVGAVEVLMWARWLGEQRAPGAATGDAAPLAEAADDRADDRAGDPADDPAPDTVAT